MIFSQKKNECNIFALFTQDRYIFCSIDFFQDLSIYCYPFILQTGKSTNLEKISVLCEQGYPFIRSYRPFKLEMPTGLLFEAV